MEVDGSKSEFDVSGLNGDEDGGFCCPNREVQEEEEKVCQEGGELRCYAEGAEEMFTGCPDRAGKRESGYQDGGI